MSNSPSSTQRLAVSPLAGVAAHALAVAGGVASCALATKAPVPATLTAAIIATARSRRNPRFACRSNGAFIMSLRSAVAPEERHRVALLAPANDDTSDTS